MSKETSNGTIQKYENELQDIRYILQNLKNGRIKEISGADSDGYLETNATKLEKQIFELLIKIDRGSDSIKDDLSKIFETN